MGNQKSKGGLGSLEDLDISQAKFIPVSFNLGSNHVTLIDSSGHFATSVKSVTLKPPTALDDSDTGKLKESIRK